MAGGSERSLAMLAAALEKEERGRDFYREAVARCTNELGKDIFRALVAEEGTHIQRIKQIYDTLQSGRQWSSEWKSFEGVNQNLQKLFEERMVKLGPKVKAESGDLEALDIGISMEQGAITFYEGELLNAVDQLEREFVECMISEERVHFASLEDMKFYLTDPESWFTEHERHGLDGG
jgi:rubrerythrin